MGTRPLSDDEKRALYKILGRCTQAYLHALGLNEAERQSAIGLYLSLSAELDTPTV
jgi:hypothetical protein